MERSTLALLGELELADAELAATLAELDELADRVEEVRRRAHELEAFLARLPDERARVDAAVEGASREEAEAQHAHALADSAFRAAESDGDSASVDGARRNEQTARDLHHLAERRLAEVREESAALERRAGSARRTETELRSSASEIATVLSAMPRVAEAAGARPQPGLSGIREWTSSARAALFVSRGGLAREREAVIRQANELGAALLDEPLVAVSAAAVARRVERRLHS
jgi:chromosome segregation protein